MKKLKIITLMLFLVITSVSCKMKHHGTEKIIVNKFKVDNTPSNKSDNDWLFWYVISVNNNYYTYSSPVPITNYNNLSWVASTTKPTFLSKEKNIEEAVTEEVEPTEFSSEIQSDIDALTETQSDTQANVDNSNDSGGGGDGGDGGGD